MPPSRPLAKWILWTLLVVSILGFADATYLTAKHYQGEVPTCILFSGCETVTTSPYATIGPVPVALLGAIFYLVVFALMLQYFERNKSSIISTIAFLSIPAALFTCWLLYVQLFVLHTLCAYCAFSALTSLTIFVLSQCARRALRRKPDSTEA